MSMERAPWGRGPVAAGGPAADRPARPRWVLRLASVAALAGCLASCGASGGSAQASSAGVKQACQEVSAALSDGPDPEADPVGYALAQVQPLRAIRAAGDKSLQGAIDKLASAYQTFYKDNGVGSAIRHSVSQASERLNALCPGAGAGI